MSNLFSQADLSIAARKMGLSHVPRVEVGDAQGFCSINTGERLITMDKIMLNRISGLQVTDLTRVAIRWNERRPYRSFLRWLLAHELGHAVQAERLGVNLFCKMYAIDYALYDQMQYGSSLAMERGYRELPFEREADEFADKYWKAVQL